MKTLVAYFSHAGQNYVNGGVAELEHGNAEVLAGFAAQACGGDLFHIERVEPYPAEYKACVKESMAELKVKARPELARDVDVSGYDRVAVVFPNWCGTMPMPVYSFLEGHDFAGKEIWPLCTHEGGGLGRSEADSAALCPGARLLPGLAVRGTLAAGALTQLRLWLLTNGIALTEE